MVDQTITPAGVTPIAHAETAEPVLSLDPALRLTSLQGLDAVPGLAQAKRAFTTRRVDWSRVEGTIRPDRAPRAGDLVLARVDALGQHQGLQLASGRRAALFAGDLVVLCYGNRYAPDQFEAEIPDDLGPCEMVAAGGLAARALSSHRRMARPTRITPLGLLADAAGQAISIDRFALSPRGSGARKPEARPPVHLVAGSSMNAGKTTSAGALIHAHARAGRRVGAAKVTGTGAFGDLFVYLDNGASTVVDFTDAGLPSTYKVPVDRLETVFHRLVDELAARGADVVVVEVADGLLQQETAALLARPSIRARVTDVLFAAGDALSAIAGADWLTRRGLAVSGLSGAFTASRLACREAGQATGRPVHTIDELQAGALAHAPEVPVALALAC